jgi:hypothetical protein
MLVPLGLLKEANLTYTSHWKGDADIPSMLRILETETSGALHKCNLRSSPYFEPTINYYRITRNLQWLETVDRKVRNDVKYDFLYVVNDKEYTTGKPKVILQNFSRSNSTLFKIVRSDGCCPDAEYEK